MKGCTAATSSSPTTKRLGHSVSGTAPSCGRSAPTLAVVSDSRASGNAILSQVGGRGEGKVSVTRAQPRETAEWTRRRAGCPVYRWGYAARADWAARMVRHAAAQGRC